jgi:hypothetical protein
VPRAAAADAHSWAGGDGVTFLRDWTSKQRVRDDEQQDKRNELGGPAQGDG